MAGRFDDIQEVRLITYDELSGFSRRLYEMVLNSNFHFTRIIGFSRGGNEIANLVSDMSGVDELDNVRIDHYTGPGQRLPEPVVKTTLDPEWVKNQKVICFDDTADTGKSQNKGRGYIESLKGDVRVATVLKKDRADGEFAPYYWLERHEDGIWYAFPREWKETIIKLSKEGRMDLLEQVFSSDRIKEAKYLYAMGELCRR